MPARKSLTFILSALLITLISGIVSAETIQFWTLPGDPYESTLREVAKMFTDETGIEVDITTVPYSEHREKLTVSVIGGSPPDVMTFERSSTKEYVGAHSAMEPLDKLLADYDWSTVLPGALEEATFKGQVYGMPLRTDVRGLYWNQNMLGSAGLDEANGPQTWQGLNEYARKLTKMNGNELTQLGFAPWYSNWGVSGWIWHYGGEVYDAENNAPDVNTPETLEVLRWYKEYGDRLGPEGRTFHAKYGSTDSSFYKGGLAMYLQSTSFLGRLATNEPDLRYMTSAVPAKVEGENGTWSGGPSLIIPKGAKNPDAAAKFIKFAMRPDIQMYRYRNATAIPANMEALFQAIEETDHAPTQNLFAQLPTAHGRPPMWVPFIVALRGARDKVLDDVAPPPAALETAQQELEAEFERVFGAR